MHEFVKLVQQIAAPLVRQHSANYSQCFEELDTVIHECAQSGTKPEITVMLVTMRKSIQALFNVASKLDATDLTESQIIEHSETLSNLLETLTLSNMQLRSYNRLFNHDASNIVYICQHQCWIANVAVIMTLKGGS